MSAFANPTNNLVHLILSEPQEMLLINMKGGPVWKAVLPAGQHKIQASSNYYLFGWDALDSL